MNDVLRIAGAARSRDSGIWEGWRRALGDLPYVALDVETTGLDPATDRIIDLALIGREGVLLESLVDPGRVGAGGPGGAAESLAPARFGDLAQPIKEVLAGRIVVGHNVRFDLAFLAHEYARIRDPLPPLPFVCTMTLADALRLSHTSRSLAHACCRHSVVLRDAHTAVGDASATARLFERYGHYGRLLGLDLPDLAGRCDPAAGPDSWRLPPLPMRDGMPARAA